MRILYIQTHKMNDQIKEIVFAQDTAERKKFFKAASFAHPAKMSLGLQIYLIEHYTKPGDVICDVMAGSGTLLVACTLGRNVILVELEDKFVGMQQVNWEKIKSQGAMLGYKMGDCKILCGDARQLPKLLADACIFSPPYALTAAKGQGEETPERLKGFMGKSCFNINRGYSKSDSNIGNLPYGSISAVISSPPYANPRDVEPDQEKDYENKRLGINDKAHGRTAFRGHYKVDVVCTSPPYEQSLTDGHTKGRTDGTTMGYTDKADVVISSPPYEKAQFDCKHGIKGELSPNLKGRKVWEEKHKEEVSQENIGNLKSDNYLLAMLEVYKNCFAVLKEKGLMVLVTKNFIRNKQIVRLDLDMIKLCEQAGFVLKERLARRLTQQSFWRIIYYKKYPDAPRIDFEDVLVFQKND
jgi:DNA modification methylase